MPFLKDMTLIPNVSNMCSDVIFKGQGFHEEVQPAYGADTDMKIHHRLCEIVLSCKLLADRSGY
jgi:hypothetical protein